MSNKPKRVITTHHDFVWPTSDDWHPNFVRNTVQVRLHDQTTGDQVFLRLSVWGADDDGMELDLNVTAPEKAQALDTLKSIMKSFPNPLTKAWLTTQGFKPA